LKSPSAEQRRRHDHCSRVDAASRRPGGARRAPSRRRRGEAEQGRVQGDRRRGRLRDGRAPARRVGRRARDPVLAGAGRRSQLRARPAGGIAPILRATRMASLSTKADEIALVLEDEIVSGTIEPGVVLRQEQLSERFGVSRTPIREALRRLAALGLVSFVPNRGVRVRTLSREELREAFLVRAELESLATELATPRMTADDLARLDEAELRFSVLTLELRAKAQTGVEDNALAI